MPRFTVVTFATEGPYEQELRRLRASCKRFDVPLVAEVVPGKGNWKLNCAMKPAFISRMMGEIEGPIVWLDADAELMAYPTAFDVLDADFACYCHQHETSRREVMSGTLFFNRGQAVSKLLTRWEMECLAKPTHWDQRCLEDVLADDGLTINVHHLPERYCWIVEPYHKRDDNVAGPPIIMHHQASRRLKRHKEVQTQ